jgi:hypothetical protein
MKRLFLTGLFFLQLPLLAKSLSCAVPENIVSTITPLFSETIAYTKRKVNVNAYSSNKEALEALYVKKAQFAVVRSDILWQLHKGSFKWSALKDAYISISILPYFANLYLVQANAYDDIDVEDLKDKNVSVGLMGESNAYLLKYLLKLTHTEHMVYYKSIAYTDSLRALQKKTIDAFFGFLPSDYENDTFHFQTIFSNQSTAFMEDASCYKVDYDGIHVPYMLIAAKDVSDEEIENVIYRLKEKGVFSPQTDAQYGPINRYVLQHLEQVQLAFNALAAKEEMHTKKERTTMLKVVSQTCLKYHYGFLKLLRRKPALKKKVRYIKSHHPSRYTEAKRLLQNIDTVLLYVDAHKTSCDHTLLAQKTAEFKNISKHIKLLAK